MAWKNPPRSRLVTQSNLSGCTSAKQVSFRHRPKPPQRPVIGGLRKRIVELGIGEFIPGEVSHPRDQLPFEDQVDDCPVKGGHS